MVEIIAVIILGVVIILQAVERYFFAIEMNKRVSESVKAVMSRNINEYISAINAEKPNRTEFTENDEIELSQASEDEFDKYIKKQIK